MFSDLLTFDLQKKVKASGKSHGHDLLLSPLLHFQMCPLMVAAAINREAIATTTTVTMVM